MCRLFGQFSLVAAVAQRFGVSPPLPYSPTHHATPGHGVPVVLVDPETETQTRRGIALLRWGFIPASASDAARGVPTIKAEALARKPALWVAVAHRRCLVPADGFYEWRIEGSERRRYWITLTEGGPFALAGLWTRWYDHANNRVVRS
jgi:putative SOS response-associated peptidase YedK